MITSMQQLLTEAANRGKKTLAVAVANDRHVLEAVHLAAEKGIVDPVLVGEKGAIENTLEALNIAKDRYEIVDVKDPTEACEKAVDVAAKDEKAFLMKGFVDTALILRAALDKEKGLRTKNRLSHVSVMEIPTYHKLLLMSDGAMNIDPDVDIKQEIVENGVVIARALGIDTPSVGVIAAIEKVNPKMQATLDAQTLIERNKKNVIEHCTIGGPFALDNAIDKDAAKLKGVADPIAGDVDFILMPQIESGNVFYKAMMFLANAKSASVIAGAKKPIVLTSRADTTESKLYSIALSALVADGPQ